VKAQEQGRSPQVAIGLPGGRFHSCRCTARSCDTTKQARSGITNDLHSWRNLGGPPHEEVCLLRLASTFSKTTKGYYNSTNLGDEILGDTLRQTALLAGQNHLQHVTLQLLHHNVHLEKQQKTKVIWRRLDRMQNAQHTLHMQDSIAVAIPEICRWLKNVKVGHVTTPPDPVRPTFA